MKLKHLFIFNAVATVIFGIGSILIPQTLIAMFGDSLTPAGTLMMRYGGAWLIGLGLLAWLARYANDSDARRAIVMASLVCYGIAFIIALLAQFNAVLNAFGWGTVALNLVLALGYAYFQFVKPDTA